MTDARSIELLNRYRRGDGRAAHEIFDRYTLRLIGLTRQRLSAKLARRIDPEDVVQSVYRSFFRAAEKGDFELQRNGDLWRLLAAITLNKVRMQARRNRAVKRSLSREDSINYHPENDGNIPQKIDGEPSPEDAAVMAEQVELLMGQLDYRQRRVLELRLQGFLLEEIANDIGCSERTVRRWMDQIKHLLQRDLDATQSAT